MSESAPPTLSKTNLRRLGTVTQRLSDALALVADDPKGFRGDSCDKLRIRFLYGSTHSFASELARLVRTARNELDSLEGLRAQAREDE